MYAIEISSLTKKFGSYIAIDNISLKIIPNEIFGFLGPNGAGKSTTMMILSTLLKPTSGKAFVNGFDIVKQAKKVRESIGYVQQDITVDEYLTGRENLFLQAQLNHIPKNLINNRIDDMLSLVELANKQSDLVTTYSGGMRKRLDIACGLLHKPQVLFLDEPTVGLDTQTRHKIWEYIKKICKEFEITVFISTHYMEEADKLCNRIGIIDNGKIKIVDSPSILKNNLGNEIITITIDEKKKKLKLKLEISRIEFVKNVVFQNNLIIIFSSNSSKVIPVIFNLSYKLGIKINSILLSQSTLDDIFIKYTGRYPSNKNNRYNMKKQYKKMSTLRS